MFANCHFAAFEIQSQDLQSFALFWNILVNFIEFRFPKKLQICHLGSQMSPSGSLSTSVLWEHIASSCKHRGTASHHSMASYCSRRMELIPSDEWLCPAWKPASCDWLGSSPFAGFIETCECEKAESAIRKWPQKWKRPKIARIHDCLDWSVRSDMVARTTPAA